jgi:hypothetical protein
VTCGDELRYGNHSACRCPGSHGPILSYQTLYIVHIVLWGRVRNTVKINIFCPYFLNKHHLTHCDALHVPSSSWSTRIDTVLLCGIVFHATPYQSNSFNSSICVPLCRCASCFMSTIWLRIYASTPSRNQKGDVYIVLSSNYEPIIGAT